MRCSAAGVLYWLLPGHVPPRAVRPRLAEAPQLSQFLALLLRARVFDLFFVQRSVLGLFHRHELNPLQTPPKPARVLTQQNCSALTAAPPERIPGAPRVPLPAGQVWAAEPSPAAPGQLRDHAAAGDGTAPPVATDNKRVATESVNSFRVWLNNSSKWKQMLISSGTAGAEGNE